MARRKDMNMSFKKKKITVFHQSIMNKAILQWEEKLLLWLPNGCYLLSHQEY